MESQIREGAGEKRGERERERESERERERERETQINALVHISQTLKIIHGETRDLRVSLSEDSFPSGLFFFFECESPADLLRLHLVALSAVNGEQQLPTK